MKTTLTVLAAASLFSAFAGAQPHPASFVRGPRPPYQKSQNHAPAPAFGRNLVYVITGGSQFGAVDLSTGTFLPIGPGTPGDVGGGLVPGPGPFLLTLTFSGNLDAIHPATGSTFVLGPTGLADCSTPVSPCGPTSANTLGEFDGRLYATDFSNNLYTINDKGKATLIGPTGIPALPFIPGPNPDGTVNVYDESIFSVGGRLYANFAAAVLNTDGTPTVLIPPAIYEINPRNGHATSIASTDLGLVSIVNVNEKLYAFNAGSGEVVTLEVRTGQTKVVSDLDPAAGLIAGATPAHPVAGAH